MTGQYGDAESLLKYSLNIIALKGLPPTYYVLSLDIAYRVADQWATGFFMVIRDRAVCLHPLTTVLLSVGTYQWKWRGIRKREWKSMAVNFMAGLGAEALFHTTVKVDSFGVREAPVESRFVTPYIEFKVGLEF